MEKVPQGNKGLASQQATHTKQGYQKSDKAIHVNKEIAKQSKVSHDTVGKIMEKKW